MQLSGVVLLMVKKVASGEEETSVVVEVNNVRSAEADLVVIRPMPICSMTFRYRVHAPRWVVQTSCKNIMKQRRVFDVNDLMKGYSLQCEIKHTPRLCRYVCI